MQSSMLNLACFYSLCSFYYFSFFQFTPQSTAELKDFIIKTMNEYTEEMISVVSEDEMKKTEIF